MTFSAIFESTFVLWENLAYFQFARVAAASALLVSITCGLLSPAIVLKQRSYLGDTLAHLVFPGVIAGYFTATALDLPVWVSLVVGAGVSGLAGNVLLGFLERRLRIPPDAAAVVTLTAFFAAGVIALAKVRGTRVDLHTILFGDVLTLDWSDVWVLGAVCMFSLGAIAGLRRHWDAWGADPEFAAISGFKVVAVERLFPVLTTFVVLSGMFAVGGLMISALLAIPAILTSPRSFFSPVTVLASTCMGLAGLVIAFQFDWPVGSSIVLVGALGVCGKAIFAR